VRLDRPSAETSNRGKPMNRIAAHGAFAADGQIACDDGHDRLGLYDSAAPLVSIGAWSCDLASDRLSWTDGVFDMFGLSSQRPLDRRETVELYSEESRERLERKRIEAITNGTGFTLDANIVGRDGAARWIRITAATRSDNGRTRTLYGMKQDITDDHARWEKLRAQAECDPLTGIANRSRFQSFLNPAPGAPARDRTGALILFDMDDFKLDNDNWGHAAGDACLIAFARRLRQVFGHAELVARIGGDEFAVLLPPFGSRREMEASVLARIGDLMTPVPWRGRLLPLSVSVGFAFASPDDRRDPQALFIAADEALYSDKSRRNGSAASSTFQPG
jgi:diguanylate cyclase (GGDEF)-like protein/PAS domain S-box-containing protein